MIAIASNVFLAWVPTDKVYFGYNAVAWSLSCEVFFYLCFPWLVKAIAALAPRGRRLLVGAVIGALAVYPGVFSLTVAPRDFSGCFGPRRGPASMIF